MAISTTQQRQNSQKIFEAIEQLEPDEADRLAQRLLQLQASRKAPHLSHREAEILQRIYLEKRHDFQSRFDELNAKRRSFTLTSEELNELQRLNDESEAFTFQRLQALAELAQLRRITLPELMKKLGLKDAPVV